MGDGLKGLRVREVCGIVLEYLVAVAKAVLVGLAALKP